MFFTQMSVIYSITLLNCISLKHDVFANISNELKLNDWLLWETISLMNLFFAIFSEAKKRRKEASESTEDDTSADSKGKCWFLFPCCRKIIRKFIRFRNKYHEQVKQTLKTRRNGSNKKITTIFNWFGNLLKFESIK